MKIKTNVLIKRLDGKPIMMDQIPAVGDSIQKLIGGHPLTVGEALATMLMQKKVAQFTPLKAYALAQRLYASEATDVDDGDIQGLRSMVEENETFTPLVCAQVLKALIDAKDQAEKKKK